MTYEFNGRKLKIPDEEIQNSMKVLGISQQEAIEMWLDDEGYTVNEIQEELTQKAKENRITATIHEAKAINPKKTQRERVQKEDPIKEQIIVTIADAIKNYCGNAEITNKTKIISFEIDGEKYEVNLIRHRKPKETK